MAKRGRKPKAADTVAAAETVTAPAVAVETRQRGRKSQYSDEQKKTFIKTVKNGRKADLSWNQILEATKTQGFKGGLPYLKQMALKAGAIRAGTARRASFKGRVRTKSSGVVGLHGVNAIVEAMVEARLSAAMKKAVAALKRATDQLQQL
jgi:hypothetical protein